MRPSLKHVSRLALLAVLGGLPGLAGAEPFRLIVTHLEPPPVPNSVMDLALELGYFERHGVEVELIRVQQTPSAIAALQAGEGEMANVGVDAVLQLAAQGVTDLRAVASPNRQLPFLITARDEIATPADLAGLRFGVGRIGSIDYSLSMNVLDSFGVDTEGLQVVGMGQPAERAQALVAGQIDATTVSIGVWLALPDKTGLHVLVDQDTYAAAAPVVNKVNVVPQAVLDARGDEVEAVLRALIAVSRDFAADPGLWAAAMVPHAPNLDEAGLQELAASFGGSWSVNGGLGAAELRYTQDWVYRTEDFAGVPEVEPLSWVDFGPLDRVLAEIGIHDSLDQPDR